MPDDNSDLAARIAVIEAHLAATQDALRVARTESLRALEERMGAVETLRVVHMQAHEREHKLSKENQDNLFAAVREAVAKADSVLTDYKRGANEWRGTLNDATNRFAVDKEMQEKLLTQQNHLEALIKSLDAKLTAVGETNAKRISGLDIWRSNQDGRMQMLAIVYGALLFLVPLGLRYLIP